MNNNEIENELKHWGILGMKWGIRNYQNPDGSLTPEGRIRYGVGPAKNISGLNDANSLSDEELRKMTKRYQQQADYYQARNNYIYQENKYRENTTPAPKPNAIARFMTNVFGRPVENFLSKNVELGLSTIVYSLLQTENPDAAAKYLSSITGMKVDSPDPLKKAIENARQQAELYKYMNEAEKNRRENEDIKSGKYDTDKDREKETQEAYAEAKLYDAKIKERDNKKKYDNPTEYSSPKSKKEMEGRKAVLDKEKEYKTKLDESYTKIFDDPDYDLKDLFDEVERVMGTEFLEKYANGKL